MNTTEKIIVGIIFASLMGWIWLTNKPSSPTPNGQGDKTPSVEQPENGQGGTTDTPTDTPTDGDTAKAVDDKTKTADATNAVKDAPKSGDDTQTTPPVVADVLREAFVGLKPAEPHVLVVPRSDTETTDFLAKITIDPEFGGITNVRLLDYLYKKDDPEKMYLGDETDPMLALVAEKEIQYSHARIVSSGPMELTIERQILGTDIVVRQSWSTNSGSYKINYELSVRANDSATDELAKLKGMRIRVGAMDPLAPPKGMFGASGMDQRLQFKESDEKNSDYERIGKLTGKKKDKLTKKFEAMRLEWVAVQNKFFTTSIRCDQEMAGFSFATTELARDEKNPKKIAYRLLGFVNLKELDDIGTSDGFLRTYDFYVGPKNYKRLLGLKKDSRQEQIMGFDIFIAWPFTFMKYIALMIYNMLTFFFGLVGNFGWSIIIATIVIRLLFSPITYKSSVWSQRMKEIQPLMAEVKKKYANDSATMNVKVMELYKEHKVNPVGGCLPIFAQIPVFFALFNVLRSAIELRHAEFLGFISDLSQPDMLFVFPEGWMVVGGMPFNLLPFLMGGAMYLQQRLMPTSAEPMQQKMMGFMTIFITFVCYSMPAGLTLYWTVSNVCSIIQYRVTHKLIEKRSASKEA